MRTLSVILIVKNEAPRIAACLSSVRAIADEIVVGDTGSTDSTAALAKAAGARVLSIVWRDDFAAARNETIRAASGDWLLHIDADEMLDPDGARRIRGLVDRDGCGADAVELVLANYCDDPRAWRWTPVEPDAEYARGFSGYIRAELLRLFRNRMGFEYREPVHENITESVIERGGRILRENILIHHYGYDPACARQGGKGAFYLAIARRKMAGQPENPKALHDFAEQALACGLTAEAEAACRNALALDPRHTASALTLANILLNRGDLEAARPLLEAVEQQGNAPPHAITALAAIDCREGRLDDARRRLEAVLEADPKPVLAHVGLARVLDRLGQPARALHELELARDLAPKLAEFQHLVRAHILRTEAEGLFQKGLPEDALPTLVEALHLDPEDPFTHNGLGVVLHALGQCARARESLERALRLAPGLAAARHNLAALENGVRGPSGG